MAAKLQNAAMCLLGMGLLCAATILAALDVTKG